MPEWPIRSGPSGLIDKNRGSLNMEETKCHVTYPCTCSCSGSAQCLVQLVRRDRSGPASALRPGLDHDDTLHCDDHCLARTVLSVWSGVSNVLASELLHLSLLICWP